MGSRLLGRLEQAIAACDEPRQADLLRAERAAALARHGQLADARLALRGLKARQACASHPALGAWLCLVQGQIEHFDALAPGARSHFQAAREQARQLGEPGLQALAAAWQANCAYNARDFDEMAAALAEGLGLARPDDHATRLRLALVRADASRLAGRAEASLRHFIEVRRHAVADGDTAMVAVMMHNRAAGQTDQLDLADAMGQPRPDEARLVLIEAESTGRLDQGLGNASLGAMTPLMRARLFAVLGRWDEAVDLFDAHLERARREGMAALAPRLMACRAWCHWRAGRPAAALADVAAVRAQIGQPCDPDDRAATHARLARLLAEHGALDEARRHQAEAQRAEAEFRTLQARLGRALDQVDAGAPAA